MKRPAKGHTPKQYAYATRKLAGGGSSKKEIALLSGFSPSVAKNAYNKIERTEGYANAMNELASKSSNVLLAILSEYQARGLKDFADKDLNGAANAIIGVWDRIDKKRAPDKIKDPNHNPLRAVMMQRVEHQTVHVASTPVEIKPEEKVEAIDLDF